MITQFLSPNKEYNDTTWINFARKLFEKKIHRICYEKPSDQVKRKKSSCASWIFKNFPIRYRYKKEDDT